MTDNIAQEILAALKLEADPEQEEQIQIVLARRIGELLGPPSEIKTFGGNEENTSKERVKREAVESALEALAGKCLGQDLSGADIVEVLGGVTLTGLEGVFDKMDLSKHEKAELLVQTYLQIMTQHLELRGFKTQTFGPGFEDLT